MKPMLKKLAAMMLSASMVTAAQAATTLNLNHQWPATTTGSKVDQWFADEIAKRTGNEVKIRIFWSEGLGKAKEGLSLLQNGAIDMAAISPAYFPAQLPFFSAPNSIPMALETVDQANTLMKRLLKEVPAYAEEADANGIKALFFHHLNPYVLVSRDKIVSTEEMDGKKVRTWGADMPRMVQAVGGTPVTLMLPEIYESLSRGVVDAAPFAVDLVVNYKIYEVAKNISEITLWEGPAWGIWISKSAWQKLTPEQQKIFEQVAHEAMERDRSAVLAKGEQARNTLIEKGVSFHTFPESEKARWRAALPDFFSDWIMRMEEQGKGDGARQTIGIWKEVVSK